MYAVHDTANNPIGFLSGDALLNRNGDVCAFVRGREVFTFTRRHIGAYEGGLFRNGQGAVVGTVSAALPFPDRRRRKRYQITRWLHFSVPAPRPAPGFRTWAIWDRAIHSLAA